jgi:hypothetical protein
MNSRPDQSPNFDFALGGSPGAAPRPAEALPAGFEPDLRAIDALLHDHAADAEVPFGLAQRVFDASVGELPARPRRPGRDAKPEPARPWWTRPIPVRGQWRGGLALAASLGLAFVIAALCLTPSDAGKTPSPSGLDTALAFDIDWQLEEVDREVGYLLETAALVSEEDVTGEIDGLFPELDL